MVKKNIIKPNFTFKGPYNIYIIGLQHFIFGMNGGNIYLALEASLISNPLLAGHYDKFFEKMNE